ncbi:unnamed protein product [Musa acuminata subsp. burmannicoides]
MIKGKNGDSFQYEQQSYSEIKWKRRRRTKRIKGWREGERIQATGRHSKMVVSFAWPWLPPAISGSPHHQEVMANVSSASGGPESGIKLAETLLLIAPRITCMALVM